MDPLPDSRPAGQTTGVGVGPAVSFAATVGLGAVLLFSIQPLLGKALLPSLGGSPLAWAAVMVFFQAIVLFGYGLSHLATSWLGPRKQAALHLLLLAGGAAMLPIPELWSIEAPSARPAAALAALLAELTLRVGLPCLAIAGTAPTIQRWFAGLGRPSAADPYWLYVASNVGSLVALFAYPLVIEPTLGIGEQTRAWSWAYAGLVAVSAACAIQLWRMPGASKQPSSGVEPANSVAPIGARTKLRWLARAAIPSALTLAATTHVTTDLAPVPLLWTVPLAAYLASFALTFSHLGPWLRRWTIPLLPIAVLPLVPLLILGVSTPIWVVAVAHLLAVLWISTVMHGELAATRPQPEALTSFYAWIGLGGVVGGLLVALAAPLLFTRALEYPLLVVAALMWLPASRPTPPRARWLASIALGGLGIAILTAARGHDPMSGETVSYAGFALMLLPFVAAHRWHRAAGWGLAALLATGMMLVHFGRPSLQTRRSAFASYRVGEDPRREIRYLAHGNTIHGAQSTRPELRAWGLPYYPPDSPMPELFSALVRERPRVAILGLGIGAMAPLGSDADWHTRFFELDPVVAELARQEFSFLDDCGERCEVVIGDGRLELEADPNTYDLIVLDAFSSSAVPVHLLTKEAFETYDARLRAHGIIAVHVTNRHVDLREVVAATAHDAGFSAIERRHVPDRERLPEGLFVASSHWILLAHDAGDFPVDATGDRWRPIESWSDRRVWTDDHANPLATYRWRFEP